MLKRKVASWKKVVLTGAAAATLGLGYWASKAVYTVKEVIDGDTFITTEDQHIRIDNINAPELQYCMGKEAKAELEKIILGKKVFLKVTYLDGYRLVASVYTLQGNVASIMLRKGLAISWNKGNTDETKEENLVVISKEAREKKIGIFSDKCTQTENLENIKCNIKGNNSERYGKIFRGPNCKVYHLTDVQLYLGDRWFCTEKEALAAGYKKGTDCP